MSRLLNSDTCIGILRRRPGVQERLATLPPQACAVSTITAFELLNGVEKARDPSAERTKATLFLSKVLMRAFGPQAAEAAGSIRADLERRGVKIGPSTTC